MWVFTLDGFYSAVQSREDTRILTVRCRSKEDAANLRERLAAQRYFTVVEHTPDRDYAWRLSVPRMAWAHYLQNAVERLDYGNFKDAVAAQQGLDRADTYHDVWQVMWEFQTDG